MIRKAIIIGSPDKDIPGVRDDMIAYPQFLKSSAGGAWRADEIVVLESPDLLTVHDAMAKARVSDYSFVAFAGHGEYSSVEGATLLQLRPGIKISEKDLMKGAIKHTLIMDSCRYTTQTILKANAVGIHRFDESDNLALSRLRFDAHLALCHPGICVLYGCSKDEGANEQQGEGGFYSSALIGAGYEWGTKASGVLGINEVHDLAAKKVVDRSVGRQNPTATFPRSVPRFPFAVSTR